MRIACNILIAVCAVFLLSHSENLVQADVYMYKDKSGVLTFTSGPADPAVSSGVVEIIRRCSGAVPLYFAKEIVRDCRSWGWQWDGNDDGKTSISDLAGWFGWLFYYPGDGLIYGLLTHGGSVTDFLEINLDSYGGTLSFGISMAFWLFPLFFIIIGALTPKTR